MISHLRFVFIFNQKALCGRIYLEWITYFINLCFSFLFLLLSPLPLLSVYLDFFPLYVYYVNLVFYFVLLEIHIVKGRKSKELQNCNKKQCFSWVESIYDIFCTNRLKVINKYTSNFMWMNFRYLAINTSIWACLWDASYFDSSIPLFIYIKMSYCIPWICSIILLI